MAQANNVRKEVERKLALENAERKLRLERERQKLANVKKPNALSRNALVGKLTALNVPALVPLRDALRSLSDPSFLNKKFNQDVYRELPQRVKDFIALPANQITRAVIISKIIEAVELAKKNDNNASFNRGVAKALVNVAPKPNNKLRVATTNTGTNANPEMATTNTGTNATGPAMTSASTQANNLTNQIANLQARLKKAQENAAKAAAEQKSEENAKVAELTKSLNETTKALERQRINAEKAVANLQAELQKATNAEKANLANKLAEAEAALKTLSNHQNRRIKELMNEKIALGRNKIQLTTEMQSKINNLTTKLSEAPTANQISNLESKLGQLTANKEKALKEVEQYKSNFASATQILANLRQKGTSNQEDINKLQANLNSRQKELIALKEKGTANVTALKNNLKAAQDQLNKMQKAEAERKAEAKKAEAARKAAEEEAEAARKAAAAAGQKSRINLFKAKVIKAKKTITNVRLNQLLENANKPNPNLPNLERQFADIAEKPRIYLFLNQFDGPNLPNYAKLEGIQTFGAKSGNVTNAVKNIEDIVNGYLTVQPKNLNLFFIGPSGSGKTFLFDKYLGKNITGKNIKGMVTAYYPTFDYDLESGILTISDESKQMSYGQFQQRFIHPTPFNPNSSRAHMSYQNQNGDVTAFDLAGTENPIAIMYEALGYNIFETKYWEKFSSASVKDIVRRVGTKKEVNQLLSALGLKANTISGLNEMVFLYVFWNYIDRKVSVGEIIAQPILSVLASKRNEAKIKMMVEIFNDIKRVFEGFWITRSLHALNLLFTNNSYKKLVKKTITKVTGTNIARSNVTGSK